MVQKKITQDDFKTDTVLQLNVSVTIGDSSTKIKPKSWTLNVTTKTDQQVIDYINNFNFTNFLKKVAIAKDATINDFKTQLKQFTQLSSSFGFSFINPANITINKIFKGTTTTEITDNDLKTIGNLNVTVNYKYGSVTAEQKINFTFPIKIYISSKTFTFTAQNIQLATGSVNTSLIAADVTQIINAINTEIHKQLVSAFPIITTTDYVLKRIENTVKIGGNLSVANTSIVFDINANENSTNFFGISNSQEIKVTITNPAP